MPSFVPPANHPRSPFARRAVLLLLVLASISSSAIAQPAPPGTTELDPLRIRDSRPSLSGSATRIDFSNQSLPAAGLPDLSRQIANFSLADAGAGGFGQIWTLRGLSNTPYFSDPSVTVYLDGLPLGGAATLPSQLFEYDQLSLQRGPQAAAFFGRAGDAGVLELSSSPPSDHPAIHLRASAGSYDQRTASVSLSTARHDRADAQLAIGHDARDGFIENTLLHRPVDDRDSTFARTRIRFRPTSETELAFHALILRSRDGTQALVPLDGPLFTLQRDREGSTDTDFTLLGATLTTRIAPGTIDARTTWSDWHLDPLENRLIFYGNFDSRVDQREKAWRQELHFNTGRFSLGASFAHTETTGGAVRAFDGYTVENSRFALRTTDAALFSHADFALPGDWTLTPGLRLQRVAKSFRRDERVPSSTSLHRADRWFAALPSLTLARSFDQNSRLTLGFGGGFKPGGYSAFPGRADLAGYDAQRLWGFDAAWTTRSADRRWSVTTRAFAYRIQGYQIERSFAVPGAFSDEYLVVNAGRARSSGAELEGTWQPAPALTFSASAGVTRATLSRFIDPFTRTDHSGRRAPYTPAGTAALRVDIRPSTTGFFASASATATGRIYFDEQETSALSQRAIILLDASLGYALPPASVALFGRNLTDRAYYRSITPGVLHGTPGAPATWGVEVQTNW